MRITPTLALGRPLPPGLADKSVAPSVLVRLPRVQGYEWIRVGTGLVLAEIGTGIVKRVIENVFD